nr:hypothetical protein [Tanacetum cinerariifolium]
MAFRPYKNAPRLLSLFNVGPPQVTSTWFTKLPPDAKLWSKDISLAYTGPDTTSSSFIDHSEKLDLPQEL